MVKRKAAPAATKRAKTRRTGVATRQAQGARTKAAPTRPAKASRTTTRKAVRPAKKAPAKARKAAPKKAAARKATARRAAVRRSPVRKAVARKAATRKVAVRKHSPRQAAARKPASRPAARVPKPAPRTPPVRAASVQAAAPKAVKMAPPLARKKPALDRARRTIADDDSIPSSLDFDRTASSARSGRHEIAEHKRDLTQTGAEITAGDVDADWQSAYNVGDEAPGGDNPTPDQDVVEEIGQALGMVYEDAEQDNYFGRMSAKTVSEATQQKVDQEIRTILDAQYALSRRLLEENKTKVELMANTLLEWETIDADQINDIMEGREPRLPKYGVPAKRPTDNGSGGVTPTATAPA